MPDPLDGANVDGFNGAEPPGPRAPEPLAFRAPEPAGSGAAMPRARLLSSLYWRIAIGFVVMLAVLLLSQAALFLWLTGRFAESVTSRSPQELADLVARELSSALTDQPALDLEGFVRNRFADVRRPFLVLMRDGRRTSNRLAALPPGFAERSARRGPAGDPRERFGPRPEGEGDRNARDPDPGRFFRRRGGRGGGPVGLHLAPVVVNGSQVGHVAVPSGPPPTEVLLRELGPTMTWSGLALLAIGSAIVALVIFRPARKRLRSLEEAARALGEGRTDVRADDRGGDEVSALARTFNQMAAELGARATALAASDRARRQLLADVSHELMTPLTAIRGYTETLAMPGLSVDDATRARYLDIVDQETYTLEAIIGDLLDLAKLEGGGATFTIEGVPVVELFGRVADRHAPTLQARHIRLDASTPDDLEAAGDLQRLEQAIQNLASNAIRHTPDGGRVELRAEPEGDQVRITVRDSGPGIPPEHLPHIFDRFYKADASRTGGRPSGSGLGLSIVRAIVERHGGAIAASNAAGGGALFELRLPRAADV
jgi:two-component system, OmpR family, sensor kinase